MLFSSKGILNGMTEFLYILYLLEQFVVGFLVQGISSHLFKEPPATNSVQSEKHEPLLYSKHLNDAHHEHV